MSLLVAPEQYIHRTEQKGISKEQHLTCRWRPGTRILAQMTDILCICMNAWLCRGKTKMKKEEARGRRNGGKIIAERLFVEC